MGSAVGLQLENRDRAGGGEREAPATAGTQTQWYAAYTRSRHEKVVAETLEKRTLQGAVAAFSRLFICAHSVVRPLAGITSARGGATGGIQRSAGGSAPG